MGLNQFSHLTEDEWRDAVRLSTRPPNLRRDGALRVHGEPMHAAPSSIDWVSKGAVTPVKNQGQCGSCWSFSTTGAMEGAYFLAGNKLTSFSEQELVSCDKSDNGCNGGWMDAAFTWIKKNGGITTEAAYPYTSSTGQTGSCKGTGGSVANSAPKGYVDVQADSVSALMDAVAQQPVSIAIQANQAAFQSYKSGVLTSSCGQQLDHGVLAVGYGTLNGVDYWKVKNSWGSSWGDDGYILIERSSKNLCGVLSAASYPTM
jgi:C1A family cysteine protease